jgi:hypothetical protein
MVKKGQINNVFVYLLSFVIVGFVGFLVVSFTSGLQDDTIERIDIDFQNDFSTMIDLVARNWQMEKVQSFKVSDKVTEVCFIRNSGLCDDTVTEHYEELQLLQESGETLALFTQDGLKSSFKTREFSFKGNSNGCFCVQPVQNTFTLLIKNNRNVVEISEM